MIVQKSLLAMAALVLAACGGEIKKDDPGNNSAVNNQTPNNLVANNFSTNGVVNNVNNTTMPPNNVNNTTMPPNNVNNTTMPPNNMTSPPNNMTSPPNNMTSPPNNMTNNGGALPIHVQLTWDTTATDLDVHVAHELATQDMNQPDLDMDGVSDPWLHMLYDCSWRNNAPDWGVPGPVNDPSEDIDDTNGLGPENINLDEPESGVTYHVGVRYYADSTMEGPTTAMVRIYIDGMLAYEESVVLNAPRDLWDVATVTDGVITPVTENGGPKIVPNYSPDF